jgi:hypothetical protein
MADTWSRAENEAIVADYLAMLDSEFRLLPFNKAAHNRALRQVIRRSAGSIERKHQNISAIMIEQGFAYIEGYKPLGNYQQDLEEVVLSRLSANRSLAEAMRQAAEAPASPVTVPDILNRLEDPPEHLKHGPRVSERPATPRLGTDWLAAEARNTSLGRAGELFVLDFERLRLRTLGKERLADRIEHVAVTHGDGAGFDIRSFERNGRDRLIEVKTTKWGKQIPFFASRNEVEVSSRMRGQYHLYRLFNFQRDPRLYALHGSLRDTCLLDPVQFSARPR